MALNKLGAFLLCAGLGTRLRPVTEIRAKPAIPFWGLPMALYSLYYLRQMKIFDVTVNLHHLPESILELCNAPELVAFQFSFSLEKEKPMGSGGALYYAKEHLQKHPAFFVMNSDEVLIPSSPNLLEKLSSHFQKTQALATLLVTDHPDLQKTLKPVWINTEGVVRGFGEKPSTTETLRPVHYVGYKIFSSQVLDLIPPGETHIFHDVLVPAMQKGALVNTVFETCRWWETGSLDGLLKATADVTRLVHASPEENHILSVYEAFRQNFSFKTFQSPRGTWAHHTTASVNPSTWQGTVFVDAHTQVAAKAVLKNCLLDKDLHVDKSVELQFLLNSRGSL